MRWVTAEHISCEPPRRSRTSFRSLSTNFMLNFNLRSPCMDSNDGRQMFTAIMKMYGYQLFPVVFCDPPLRAAPARFATYCAFAHLFVRSSRSCYVHLLFYTVLPRLVMRSTSHLRIFLCGALVPVAPLFTMAILAHFGVAVCRCMWVGGWDYHIM
ncbi:hypothetical protein C8J57DRAFT_1558393 [Mycena rebaudengoi]|nr:hypothetical protein C8J57DRAFT_1558393 [Mycena rebaudengoi]